MSDNNFDGEAFDVEVDVKGLRCPEPLMVVRNRMMDMQSGEIVKVTATDPSTSWDFPKFCNFLGHELLHRQPDDTGRDAGGGDADTGRDAGKESEYVYWIRKG